MNMRVLPSSASGILSYFTRHGTAANLILVVMLVLGVAASTQIRSQFFPDVVIDNVKFFIVFCHFSANQNISLGKTIFNKND